MSKNLQAENERLQAELTALQSEHKIVVKSIIKILQSIEIWPIQPEDNLMSKSLKAVKSIVMESMLNPAALEKRFDFLKDVYPLCEKYKDFKIEENG
jgi:hypothetical protein